MLLKPDVAWLKSWFKSSIFFYFFSTILWYLLQLYSNLQFYDISSTRNFWLIFWFWPFFSSFFSKFQTMWVKWSYIHNNIPQKDWGSVTSDPTPTSRSKLINIIESTFGDWNPGNLQSKKYFTSIKKKNMAQQNSYQFFIFL